MVNLKKSKESKLNISNQFSSKGKVRQFKNQSEMPQIEFAVLLASHGDIDKISEADEYIKTAYKKNDAVPIPSWLRELTKEPAYLFSRKIIYDQYKKIGPTHYRQNTQNQLNAISKAFKEKKISARAYAGYNFTHPFISQTLEQMQRDGVSKIVLINQGAQFSYATGGENIKDVKNYLKKNPKWDVDVHIVNQFSDDPRFRELLARSLKDDVKRLFPNDKPEDVSILLGSHGMPLKLIEKGDPAVPQMQHLVKDLRNRLHNFNIYHGYLNDDFFPGAKWMSPEVADVAKKMHHEGRRKVLLDGRLSFTVHHRATLYDLDKVARVNLCDKGKNNQPTIDSQKDSSLDIQLAPNFDGNIDFARLIRDISLDALKGKGDVSILRYKGNFKEPLKIPLSI